jgi:hypothetical protein
LKCPPLEPSPPECDSYEVNANATFPRRQAALIALATGLVKVLLAVFAIYWIRTHGQELKICSWDCGYYKEIAATGYRFDPVGHGPLAFFPLFPAFIHALQNICGISFEGTAIVANLFLFTMALFLFFYWGFLLGLGKHYFLPALLWAADRNTGKKSK